MFAPDRLRMEKPLSITFRSMKARVPERIPITELSKPSRSLKRSSLSPSPAASKHLRSGTNSIFSKQSWSVYLILSTNPPIKTYVGVTTDFCRRLKQHNGEIRGGAKASHAGRPWICACIIRGFKDKSKVRIKVEKFLKKTAPEKEK